MDPKTILVVDDDADFCELLAEQLTARGYRVVSELDGKRVMNLLRAHPVDMVVLDLVLPTVDGLNLLKEIRTHSTLMPIIILTGYGSIETAVEAMQAGASDFVTKPVDGALLDLRIKKALELEHTRRLANSDGLTGLYNHRYFQERLQQEVNRAYRYRHPLSLLLADIDHFKDFNDHHGHPKGDEALIAVARILQQLTRATDLVARYGGEEFAIILPETTLEKAQVFGNRICEHIAHHNFGREDNLPQDNLTISIGIATFDFSCTKEDLIEAADLALYQAKRQGRNCVCVAAA